MSRLKEVMEPGGKKEKAKSFRLTAKANALLQELKKVTGKSENRILNEILGLTMDDYNKLGKRVNEDRKL